MRILHSPPTPSTCFFCGQKPNKPPRNPRAFKCQECSCWNRYDENGEIMSDEPAMHEESLNASSFAKRASPSKNRFLTANANSPFCRTCLTNQTLLINLLSNYLPPSDDPSYETLIAEMPAYKTALEDRYPPVCQNCAFNVDESIKSKEHMARTAALGSWLKQSQDVGSKRSSEQQNARREMLVWRIRGGLWIATVILFICVNISSIFEYYDLDNLWVAIVLPVWTLLSIFWAFWDPTWTTVRISRLQGRGFTVVGRERYIYCQVISWIIRLFTSVILSSTHFKKLPDFFTPERIRIWYISSITTELFLGLFWMSKLRIKKPPKVRLLGSKHQPDVSSRATSPAVPPADVSLSNLSLLTSSKPPVPQTKHVFGQSSFPKRESEVSPEDMMDWTPSNSPDKAKQQAKETWIRPQKFFPPEQPTGLEDLFQKAAKLDDASPTDYKEEDGGGWSWWKQRWKLQDYKVHIYMVLVGAMMTFVMGLAYISMQRLFISKTPQAIYVRLDDL